MSGSTIASKRCRSAALLDVGVGDVLELELVLFEQPPRPAFVDALDPRLVEADAGAADRPRVGRCAVARRGGTKPEIARHAFHGVADALRFRHEDRSGRIRVALQRQRRGEERHARAGLEQAIDGDAAGIATPVDHVEGRLRTSPQTFAGGNRHALEPRGRPAARNTDRCDRRGRSSAAAASSRPRRTADPAPRRAPGGASDTAALRAASSRRRGRAAPSSRCRCPADTPCRPRETAPACRRISTAPSSSSCSSLRAACGSN